MSRDEELKPKLMYSYTIIFKVSEHMTHTQSVMSSEDLIQAYKNSLLNNNCFIAWEDGVLDSSKVAGIYRVPRHN